MSRFRLYAAMAVIAAAIADPVVEFASNAGWFGRGRFTDQSNLDVAPALVLGVGLLALYLVTKARALTADRSLPRGIVRALPLIFVLQILTLYVMETIEQLVACGRVLGPTVWLGGPVSISLAIHAAIGVAVAYSIARSMRRLAATTLRVICLIRAIATFAARAEGAIASRRFDPVCLRPLSRALRWVGERAPPPVRG